MNNRAIKVIIVIVSVIIICGGIFYVVEQRASKTKYIDALPPDVVNRLDNTPESSLPENQIMLPNGQNLSDYKKSRGL